LIAEHAASAISNGQTTRTSILAMS